jgi:hypothetical protein
MSSISRVTWHKSKDKLSWILKHSLTTQGWMNVEIARQPPLLVPRFLTPTSWCKVPLYLEEALFMQVRWPPLTLETSRVLYPKVATLQHIIWAMVSSLAWWIGSQLAPAVFLLITVGWVFDFVDNHRFWFFVKCFSKTEKLPFWLFSKTSKNQWFHMKEMAKNQWL